MNITVNGEIKDVPSSVNIKYIAGFFHLDPSKVVFELNGKILQKDEWGSSCLKENDRIEIITFVGGG